MVLNTSIEINQKIFCKLNSTIGVDVNHVIVGREPVPVKSFLCISFNFDYMNCTFQSNSPNGAKYELQYKQMGNYKLFSCIVEKLNSSHYGCLIYPIRGEKNYQNHIRYFHFKLKSKNLWGEFEETIQVNHFENVVLNAPEVFEVLQTGVDYVTLRWIFSRSLFLKQITFEMKISCDCEKHWRVINEWDYGKKIDEDTLEYKFRMDVKNLKFAYNNYRIAFRMKTKASRSNQYWSPWSEVQFLTNSSLPGRPPNIDKSSFYFEEKEIHIYWKSLAKCQWKDKNVKYLIEISPSSTFVSRFTSEKTGIKIPITHEKQIIKIWSVNSIGKSQDYKTIKIPDKPITFLEARKITKYYEGNNSYMVSWEAPQSEITIEKYTVFWCQPKGDFTNQCSDTEPIDFRTFQSTVTSFSLEYKGKLNFAVAASG